MIDPPQEHHGHSHGLIDASIKRSRAGLVAVGLWLAVLAVAALIQLAIYVASGSVALLADLIHNFGDAATAIPLAVAFLMRSPKAEEGAGLFVVFAIFASACVAGVESVSRLLDPQAPPTSAPTPAPIPMSASPSSREPPSLRSG
jgi:divalent metal cation (Fe/Co/Zn/Cd) transporter